jgi:serine/threonine protein kinase
MPLGTPGAVSSVGNYDIVAKIAEGGMGTVYKARHRPTGMIVAVKIVAPAAARNPVLMTRFEREFQAAHVLDHPNIVRAIELHAAGPMPFLAMEFVEGESLGQKVERDGRMSEADALPIIVQVCRGLHYAHKQGLIHRDIKPDNVLLTKDATAKITDLGLVKDIEGELNLTRTGRGLGTPHFMAPEQFRNAKNADMRCDIYSLGATLYMMVTGEMPFAKCGPLDAWMKKVNNDFPAPKEIFSGVSDRVNWAIRRAMSGDPDKRPANCLEFEEDITGRSAVKPFTPLGAQVAPVADLWYLVYKDEVGETHTVKGNTEVIRRALSEGRLGDAENVRAARSKAGPFQPLRSIAEFRDLIIEPAPLPPPPGARTTPTRATPPGSGAYARPTPTGAAAPTATTPVRVGTDDAAVDLGAPLSAERGGSGRHSATRKSGPLSGKSSGRHPTPGKVGPSQSSGRIAPSPVTDPTASPEASGKLPHIPMSSDREMPAWLMMTLMLLVALATTFTAFYFLQQHAGK